MVVSVKEKASDAACDSLGSLGRLHCIVVFFCSSSDVSPQSWRKDLVGFRNGRQVSGVGAIGLSSALVGAHEHAQTTGGNFQTNEPSYIQLIERGGIFPCAKTSWGALQPMVLPVVRPSLVNRSSEGLVSLPMVIPLTAQRATS